MARPAAQGMTLVEILLVLCIIGLGWFTLLPKMNLADRPNSALGRYPQLNSLLAEVRREAQATGRIQVLAGEAGRDKLTWRDKEAKLPGIPVSVEVGGRKPSDPGYAIRVYPGGTMDNALLSFGSGEVLESRPLSCRFDNPQPEERKTSLGSSFLRGK